MLLDGLRKRLGPAGGETLFDDLSERFDADTPTTGTRSFPYDAVPSTRAGNAILDAGSLKRVQAAGGAASAASAQGVTSPHWSSNFLLVGANRSTTGHPLFVGGPQIGYFYPGLTLEADIKGPGFQARGVYSPANPGTILIGRGPDFAWSLTSAGSDLIDEYAETLCGGSRTRYRYKGRCRTMGSVDAGTIVGQGRVRYRTTVHGPVTGYATVGGKPVAISRKRSSFGRDILWQLSFRRATMNRITGTRSFVDAFATSPFTFNVGYADDRDIAIFSAGRLPQRDRGASTRAYRPAARASTSGMASCPRPSCPSRSTRRAGSCSTGTTSRCRASRRPTTTGPTARCTASPCSRPASPSAPTTTSPRSQAR